MLKNHQAVMSDCAVVVVARQLKGSLSGKNNGGLDTSGYRTCCRGRAAEVGWDDN